MMKNLIPFCCVIVIGLFQSCKTGNSSTTQKDTVFTTSNYMAIDGKDTALMNLEISNEIVKGKLILKLYNKEDNDGFVSGAFKNDTLFVDYSFRVGNKKIVYKNPLAFLKKDGLLTLGVGKMENMFGRTYFRKDIPIDFYEGRFKFGPVPIQ